MQGDLTMKATVSRGDQFSSGVGVVGETFKEWRREGGSRSSGPLPCRVRTVPGGRKGSSVFPMLPTVLFLPHHRPGDDDAK